MSAPYFKLYIIAILCCIISACSSDNITTNVEENPQLFDLLSSNETGIDFKNSITESDAFNFLFYPYIYNGGSVAIGDIDNDGLEDIYFGSNQNTNKLYLNKGDLKFEDISSSSETEDNNGWTTGVSMVDINNDGLLDIYVCKSGSLQDNELRRNKLFLNKGNKQFIEVAKSYGLDDPAFSTQAYFFDYDKDGDLDMYLVNHREDFRNNSRINTNIQRQVSNLTSDKLYRNDGGKFSNVTQTAGITNKTWGLSASIQDFNNDGWPDIYVANDFLEPDHLWINNKNGGFEDKILEHIDHISFYSMGSDIGDINNDLQNDLIVLDMVSSDHVRSKRNMASMSTNIFYQMVDIGYHHQYMANMLHLNRGSGAYSEIGHAAGVAKTDWSWAPLFADFDNDGFKDLFVTNGIKRDVTDNDYKIKLKEINAKGQSLSLDQLFDMVPAVKTSNYIFKNNGDLAFSNQTDSWGLNQKLNSNGAAYADLDNDGDLDLVVNNMEDQASVYRNNSKANYLKIKLEGPVANPSGIGAKIVVKTPNTDQLYNQYLNRGFQSSVSAVINVGLGKEESISSLEIEWPDGRYQKLENPSINSSVTLSHKNASGKAAEAENASLFSEIDAETLGIDYEHKENQFNDFDREILLPQKQSTLGPAFSIQDVNGDGKSDIFIGGAMGSVSQLYLQNINGTFTKSSQQAFNKDRQYEDVASLFFDYDSDGDVDLYVCSGGNEQEIGSAYQDRLYLNNGNGSYTRSNALPKMESSTKVVKAADYDSDGDLDLFVGSKVIPGKYPSPPDSYLLLNENGTFKDVTDAAAPELRKLGMVTDALFEDYDGDNDLDLLIVGEWMSPKVFVNESSQFKMNELNGTDDSGWYYAIETTDLDNDGDNDILLGNLGNNNKFGAKKDKAFHVYCNDFDDSGNLDIVLSKESSGKLLPVRGRECSSQQMPFILDKFPTYQSFAEADLVNIYGDDKLSDAIHFEVRNFKSYALINKGGGKYEEFVFPAMAQIGPTLDFEVLDINNDGNVDVIGAGNINNAEVETIRYDASKGFVLLSDGKGNLKEMNHSGLLTKGNVKAIKQIKIGADNYLVCARNNGKLQFFKWNK